MLSAVPSVISLTKAEHHSMQCCSQSSRSILSLVALAHYAQRIAVPRHRSGKSVFFRRTASPWLYAWIARSGVSPLWVLPTLDLTNLQRAAYLDALVRAYS